jgi:nucleotide-binding universal stress UspA family protein
MQKNINKILVPTDFSKTGLLAVEHAAFMAKLFKADLYLLHVVEIMDLAYNLPGIVIQQDVVTLKTAAEEQINILAGSVQKTYNIKVFTLCFTGSISGAIADTVSDKSIDIVVMGTHGAHGFKEFFVGSNAYKTVSLCPCPVITVQTDVEKLGFANIVLPIDDCFDSRQKVNFTLTLGKNYASKIHILGLVDDTVNLNTFKVKLGSVEKLIKESGLNFETHIVNSSDFALDTLRYARKAKADLIAVLTDHESKYKGKFMGLFAQQVVNHSKIPVLNIHPADVGVSDSVSLAGSNAN